MAGNSQRRGAVRKSGKGPTVGSGGQRRRGLEGKGPTPKATDRENHKAHKRAQAAGSGTSSAGSSAQGRYAARPTSAGRPTSGDGRGSGPGSTGRGVSSGRSAPAGRGAGPSRASRGSRPSAPGRRGKPSSEVVAGRNSVVEALRADIPASTLFIASRIDSDDRVREALTQATQRGIPILECPRAELDRITDGAVHQGLALQVPPYPYADPDDLIDPLTPGVPLIVALDGITDPRNLGAIIRSVAAFGGHGVVVPERRSVGMTASAWTWTATSPCPRWISVTSPSSSWSVRRARAYLAWCGRPATGWSRSRWPAQSSPSMPGSRRALRSMRSPGNGPPRRGVRGSTRARPRAAG